MEYVQLTLDDWMRMKEELERDIQGVQEGFIRIGYKLRKIDDGKLYENDGCASLTEWAEREYHLSASTVSRFMAINKKYSVDGYSEYIRPEFANMGSTKLAEMLTLPKSDLEMIRPETTKESIREIKRFNREAAAEGTDSLKELVAAFWETKQDLLKEMDLTADVEELSEQVNPSGNKTFRKGAYIMIMYEDNIKVKKYGQVPETLEWADFFALTGEIIREKHAESVNDQEDEMEREPDSEGEEPDMQAEPENEQMDQEAESGNAGEAPENVQNGLEKEEPEDVPEEMEDVKEESEDIQEEAEPEGPPQKEEPAIKESGQQEPEKQQEEEFVAPAQELEDQDKAPVSEVEKEEGKKTPKKQSEAAYQVRRCLSNMQVEINAKAWKAALDTVEHMAHYLKLVIEEEDGAECS